MARAGRRSTPRAQPAALALGHRRVEVTYPVEQHRRISPRCSASSTRGPAACQPTRVRRAEGLDGEDDIGAHDARVEGEAALDVPAWHVEESRVPERRVVHGLNAPLDLRRPRGDLAGTRPVARRS